MKKLLLVFLLFSLTACNTVEGVGKDIQKAAEWTKDKISGNKSSGDSANTPSK